MVIINRYKKKALADSCLNLATNAIAYWSLRPIHSITRKPSIKAAKFVGKNSGALSNDLENMPEINLIA